MKTFTPIVLLLAASAIMPANAIAPSSEASAIAGKTRRVSVPPIRPGIETFLADVLERSEGNRSAL